MTYTPSQGMVRGKDEWMGDALGNGGTWDFLTDGLTSPSGWTMNYSFSTQTPTTCEFNSSGQLDIVIPSLSGTDRSWFELTKTWNGRPPLAGIGFVHIYNKSDFSANAAASWPNNTVYQFLYGANTYPAGSYTYLAFQRTTNEVWFQSGRGNLRSGLGAIDWRVAFESIHHFSPAGYIQQDDRAGGDVVTTIDDVYHNVLADKGWFDSFSTDHTFTMKFDTTSTGSASGLDALIDGPTISIGA